MAKRNRKNMLRAYRAKHRGPQLKLIRGTDYITVDGITVYKDDKPLARFCNTTGVEHWGRTACVWWEQFGHTLTQEHTCTHSTDPC